MLYTLWSAKGGSGTTVTAALLAASLTQPPDALLVDLRGDLPGVLGAAEPPEGLAEMSAAGALDRNAIGSMEREVGQGLSLIGRGSGEVDATGLAPLWDVLGADARDVVVDAGTLAPDDVTAGRPDRAAAVDAVRRAERSLLVVRSCYLGLRASIAMLAVLPAVGCILVMEPGRLLQSQDVATVLGVPVLAELHVSTGVARAADAGLLLRKPDRPSIRALRWAAAA